MTLKFDPILPSWLFTTKACGEFPANTYSFKLFSKIIVCYHNPKLKDTFGNQGVMVQKIILTYPKTRIVDISGGLLQGSHALDVRDGLVERVDVFLN